MKIALIDQKSLFTNDVDLLVLGIFSKETKGEGKAQSKQKSPNFVLPNEFKTLDTKFSNQLVEIAFSEGFDAKLSETFVIHTLGKVRAKSVCLLGLGEKGSATQETYRRASAQAIKVANTKRCHSLGLALAVSAKVPFEVCSKAQIEGALLANYQFDKYLSEKGPKTIKEIFLAKRNIRQPKKLLDNAKAISDGVCFARDLVNEGPLELDPTEFTKRAQKKGKAAGLDVKVYDEKALAKEKMGLMLAVAKASLDLTPPRLVRLAYRPPGKAKCHVVLVGKGVTFDSGGLDIKPAAGMLDMKVDMSGAAAVAGAMIAIGQIKPRVAVTGYLACVENGIGSAAYHPGDILKSRKGLTVEIFNTDAEGRLVLADALDLAQEKEKPDYLIDIATLTGACMVALGPSTAGIFTNDESLFASLIRHGKNSGEDFWRLPLNEDLFDQLKSPIADLKNCGERWGGSITAALFLKRFIQEGTKWAHLDIAGPATNEKPHPYIPKGGAGFAVRTLVEFVTSL